MRNCSHIVSIALIMTAFASTAFAVGKKQTEIQMETHSEKIRPGIEYQFSRSLRPGRLVRAQEGQDGLVEKTFRVTYVSGKPVSKELIKKDIKWPHPIVFMMGRGGMPSDRGSFSRKRVLDMMATAYDPGPGCNGGSTSGRTCTGARATFGVVAVDPRVIPLGSIVFVEGYGLARACDTGSAIKGNRIDLCYDSSRVADGYGRKMVRVHVLSIR